MVSQDKLTIHFESRDPYELGIDYLIKKENPIFKVNEYEDFTIEVELSEGTKVFILDKDCDKVEITDEFFVEKEDYIPGYGLIIVERFGQVYHKFFEITAPRVLGKEGLTQIRNIIESLSPGLSLDFKASFLSDIVAGDMMENVMKIKCNYLYSRADMIIKTLNKIIQSPIVVLEKEIVKEKTLKKQNVKSLVKNSKNTSNEYVYNVKSKEKYNSQENAALYFILLNIKRHIMSICNSINFNKTSNLNRIILEKLDSISAKINSVVEELGLRRLSISSKTITPKFLKVIHYNQVLDIYKVLNADSINLLLNYTSKSHIINYKSTPLLFELFNYLMVKNILIKNGYIYQGGNETENKFTSVFISDSKKVEVIFGIDVRMVGNTDDYYGLVSVVSKKVSPDIVVNIYDLNNKILSSNIIEVKCRWFKGIYDGNYETPTSVLEQLRSYYQYRFKEKGSDVIDRKFSIDKIICTYPYDLENQFLHDEYENIYYIGLELDKNFENTQGYKMLEEVLINGSLD